MANSRRLVDALHDVAAFTRRDRNRWWTCALDVHYVPFYGDHSTPGTIGAPKKAGTSFFRRVLAFIQGQRILVST